jgi:TolB-like protein/Tfp pilus assembly protein PilF
MNNNNLCYEFGPYQLDLCKRILTRDGDGIPLTPKATEILIALVKNAGQLVEKDELLKEVWPDTFVEESNLTQNIFTLRKVLGDDRSGPKYIETVARRGYRFLPTVRTVSHVENGDSRPQPAGVIPQSPVVAVLPFINNTDDPELEYLADGITGNLINNLSRITQLRVMSRSRVLRYNSKEVEPQEAGKELRADAVLVGKINSRSSGLIVNVELVEVGTGYQIWGNTFDSELKDLLEIQESIAKQTLTTLKLKLTGAEERQITARYTEYAEAYQTYLEGRYHSNSYTKKGLEKAINHFRRAIELDPNYCLAYVAIIDCYLRLATNYLPAQNDFRLLTTPVNSDHGYGNTGGLDPRVRLRFEWDWKSAERELRRANDLGTDYPAPYQWYVAYRFSMELFISRIVKDQFSVKILEDIRVPQLHSRTLSPNEESQILCAVAREQIEVGNYDAGRLILSRHWTPGEWPKFDGLTSPSAADLLFTAGSLAGCLSSTGRIQKGQKHAEALLSGAIGIFEHLGAKRAAAEAKIELALSYYRQGLFDLSSNILLRVIEELQTVDNDLKSLALIRLAVVERHAGHVADSLSRLSAANTIMDQSGPLVTGRYHQELAAVLKDAAIGENRSEYTERIQTHLAQAYYEFHTIGHFRYTAVVENNHGYFLLDLGLYDEAEAHLLHARELFGRLDDKVRKAQVDDCLSKVYMATDQFQLAESVVERAILSLEADDEEALLAEALTTKGRLLCKTNRHSEGREILEGAWRIYERCGDNEGAGRALLTLIEETYTQMNEAERHRMVLRIRKLLENTQQASTRARLIGCLKNNFQTD